MLHITDVGPAFDPTANQPREITQTLDNTTIGGHGLRQMLHYLRELRYAREGECNILTMVVATQPQGPAFTPEPA